MIKASSVAICPTGNRYMQLFELFVANNSKGDCSCLSLSNEETKKKEIQALLSCIPNSRWYWSKWIALDVRTTMKIEEVMTFFIMTLGCFKLSQKEMRKSELSRNLPKAVNQIHIVVPASKLTSNEFAILTIKYFSFIFFFACLLLPLNWKCSVLVSLPSIIAFELA